MIRQLLARLLRADLEPQVAWSEAETMPNVASLSVEVPRLWSRTEKLEQVLCATDDHYVLFKRWSSSRQLMRLTMGRRLNAREMRITEFPAETHATYQLALCPLAGNSNSCRTARPTWFGLWHNEPPMNFGGMCFVECSDRDSLKALRSRLLDGKVPAELQTEEAMWERIQALPELDRRAAYAELTMRQFGELDRQFQETHGDLGPVPGELKPMFKFVQQKRLDIEGVAAARPVDPETAQLIERFTKNINEKIQSSSKTAKPKPESGPK